MEQNSVSDFVVEESPQETPDVINGNGPDRSDIPSASVSAPPSAEIDNDKSFSAANLFNPQLHRENRLRQQKQKALKAVVKYNTFLNQQRINERRCSFDLQTNIVHFPRRPVNVLPIDPELEKLRESLHGNPKKTEVVCKIVNAYPVALLHYPAQYVDTVPVFTPKELSFLPLNTVIHSASSFAIQCLNMSVEEYQRLKSRDGIDHGIVDSEDDSDLSDKEEDNKKETDVENGTEKTNQIGKIQSNLTSSKKRKRGASRDETSQTGIIKAGAEKQENESDKSMEVEPALVVPKEEDDPCPPNKCYACHVRARQPAIKSEYDFAPPKKKNRKVLPEMNAGMLEKEKKIGCSKCEEKFHPSCMQLPKATLFCIRQYSWQCPDCKICLKCTRSTQEEKLMFCDLCDRGYHSFCVGVPRIPHGRWLCEQCAKCSHCGSERANLEGKRGRACIWQIDWEEDDDGDVTSVSSLCFPCYKKGKASKEGDAEAVPEADEEHAADSSLAPEEKID